jgi:hypothetical protein
MPMEWMNESCSFLQTLVFWSLQVIDFVVIQGIYAGNSQKLFCHRRSSISPRLSIVQK